MKHSPSFFALFNHFSFAWMGACLAFSCAGASPEPAAAPSEPALLVEPETVHFVAGPSPEEIRAAVTKRDEDLRQCYLVGTFKDAQLVGTVSVTFTINTEGRVIQTMDSGSDLPDPEVITCVLDVFASLEFPAGASSETEVTYPVNFGNHG